MRTKFRYAALLLVAGSLPAQACGYDGLLGDGFGTLHPKSIDVAIAIRGAIDTGVLPVAVVHPVVPGNSGYWRAVGRVTKFQRLLSLVASEGQQFPALSLVFVDSKLWSRPAIRPEGLQVHVAGPRPGDTVLVTSEAVLAAILDGSVAIETAIDRGILSVDGPKADAARALVSVALAGQRVAAQATGSTPVSLFGPAGSLR